MTFLLHTFLSLFAYLFLQESSQRLDDNHTAPADFVALDLTIQNKGWNAGDLVFCSEIGRPLNPKTIRDQFDSMLRKAELPDIRFHDLRHTYAALSIAAGVDIFTLSRRMGHSTISVTADRYGHLY
jgi:integrase